MWICVLQKLAMAHLVSGAALKAVMLKLKHGQREDRPESDSSMQRNYTYINAFFHIIFLILFYIAPFPFPWSRFLLNLSPVSTCTLYSVHVSSSISPFPLFLPWSTFANEYLLSPCTSLSLEAIGLLAYFLFILFIHEDSATVEPRYQGISRDQSDLCLIGELPFNKS